MHVRDHAHGAVGAGQLLDRLLEVVVARVRDLVDTDCGAPRPSMRRGEGESTPWFGWAQQVTHLPARLS